MSHRLIHYLLLILILISGLIFYQMLGEDKNLKFLLSAVVALIYIIWGILFHYKEGDLHLKVVIEYGLIAAIAIILMRGIIFR